MWHNTVSHVALRGTTPWKVERFRTGFEQVTVGMNAVPIGEIVSVREETADPTSGPFTDLPYVGLDGVESETGELVQIRSARDQAIKSRSRVFRQGDVLYGRLRAYLNKVAYIESNVALGLCSGEFYVLTPVAGKIEGRYLQWLLSSEEMVQYVTLRLAGATHPRLSIADLLAYRVTLPRPEDQAEAVKVIDGARRRRQEILSELRSLRATTSAAVSAVTDGGQA
jgi:hypothetical protein